MKDADIIVKYENATFKANKLKLMISVSIHNGFMIHQGLNNKVIGREESIDGVLGFLHAFEYMYNG